MHAVLTFRLENTELAQNGSQSNFKSLGLDRARSLQFLSYVLSVGLMVNDRTCTAHCQSLQGHTHSTLFPSNEAKTAKMGTTYKE